MPSPKKAEQRPGRAEVPEFSTILRTVALLVALSAVLAVSIAALNAFISVPFAGDLIHAFTESFKAGLAGMVGLLAGWAATTRAPGRRG
jgi:hypothetical protein